MSKGNIYRKSSFRKHIKPMIDIDEDEDNKRRDSSGRKRVDVIECLLESSSDENDNINVIHQNSTNILWLTFAEICHIRSVLAQTTLSTLMFNKDKQYSKIIHGHLCFRCRKPIDSIFFLPSFLYSTNSSICFICQQKICKKCSLSNFIPPVSKHCFPVRLQTLIKSSSSSIPIENELTKNNQSNFRIKTICYDCSQIFKEYTRPSKCSINMPVTDLRQSFSFIPLPSYFNKTQNNHSPIYLFDDKIGKTTITPTSFITQF